MKKFVSAALAATLAVTLTACSGSSTASDSSTKDHLTRIQEAGVLNIGLEGDWQPFCYHDDSDTLVGFDVEVASAIAEKLGVEAKFTEGAWDGLFAGLSNGVYDVVVNGVDITDERKETYDFTDPYAYDHMGVVTLATNETITSFEDLAGKTTANSIGSTYMEVGESYGATVSGVDTLAETMELVLNGTVDATINAQTSIQDYLNTTGETRLKVVAVSEDATAYAIPLVKGEDNATLLEAINNALRELREDGTLAEISNKYFGADLTNE